MAQMSFHNQLQETDPEKQIKHAPLADRLRPQSITEVVGQDHLLNPGRALRCMFDNGELSSLVLWGPPGSGKTTIARLLAKPVRAKFESLSAVMSGVKQLREINRRFGKGLNVYTIRLGPARNHLHTKNVTHLVDSAAVIGAVVVVVAVIFAFVGRVE